MRHLLMHVAGCALPLLAVFLLPLFGVDNDVAWLVFIVLMFGCHLLMLRGHNHGSTPTDKGDAPHEHD